MLGNQFGLGYSSFRIFGYFGFGSFQESVILGSSCLGLGHSSFWVESFSVTFSGLLGLSNFWFWSFLGLCS